MTRDCWDRLIQLADDLSFTFNVWTHTERMYTDVPGNRSHLPGECTERLHPSSSHFPPLTSAFILEYYQSERFHALVRDWNPVSEWNCVNVSRVAWNGTHVWLGTHRKTLGFPRPSRLYTNSLIIHAWTRIPDTDFRLYVAYNWLVSPST